MLSIGKFINEEITERNNIPSTINSIKNEKRTELLISKPHHTNISNDTIISLMIL